MRICFIYVLGLYQVCAYYKLHVCSLVTKMYADSVADPAFLMERDPRINRVDLESGDGTEGEDKEGEDMDGEYMDGDDMDVDADYGYSGTCDKLTCF